MCLPNERYYLAGARNCSRVLHARLRGRNLDDMYAVEQAVSHVVRENTDLALNSISSRTLLRRFVEEVGSLNASEWVYIIQRMDEAWADGAAQVFARCLEELKARRQYVLGAGSEVNVERLFVLVMRQQQVD